MNYDWWKEAFKPKIWKVKWMGYLAKDVNVQVKLMKGFMWDKENSSTMNQMFNELFQWCFKVPSLLLWLYIY